MEQSVPIKELSEILKDILLDIMNGVKISQVMYDLGQKVCTKISGPPKFCKVIVFRIFIRTIIESRLKSSIDDETFRKRFEDSYNVCSYLWQYWIGKPKYDHLVNSLPSAVDGMVKEIYTDLPVCQTVTSYGITAFVSCNRYEDSIVGILPTEILKMIYEWSCYELVDSFSTCPLFE